MGGGGRPGDRLPTEGGANGHPPASAASRSHGARAASWRHRRLSTPPRPDQARWRLPGVVRACAPRSLCAVEGSGRRVGGIAADRVVRGTRLRGSCRGVPAARPTAAPATALRRAARAISAAAAAAGLLVGLHASPSPRASPARRLARAAPVVARQRTSSLRLPPANLVATGKPASSGSGELVGLAAPPSASPCSPSLSRSPSAAAFTPSPQFSAGFRR